MDYLLLYTPVGQTGETAIQLENPVLNLSDFPNVSSRFSNGLLTLDYTVGGNQLISIQDGNKNLGVMILDKHTAYGWHAPILAQNGTFSNYFSVGSNDT